MEEWKPVVGFEGLYEVSNHGRVRSLNFKNTNTVQIMTLSMARNGYLIARLMKDGRKYHVLVHRAVAMAFLDNPHQFPVINHKDECKTNNSVENLEWCTQSYNIKYGTATSRIAKALSVPVLQYGKDGTFIKGWKSAHEVSRELGIDRKSIRLCCSGEYRTAGGYIWKYDILGGVNRC